MWRVVRRQASRLLVTHDTISLVRGAAGTPKVLTRTAGEHLRFIVRGSGRLRTTALEGPGDEPPLDIQFFKHAKVTGACADHG